TVNLFYGMQGLSNVDKQAFLLDASGDIVDTLDEVLTLNWNYAEPNVFIPSVTGIYYLHYRGLGDEDTYWSDTSYTLHLRALIQIRGMLSVWDYSPASYTLSSGDTLFLDSLLSFVSIVPSDASRNYKVLLARSERTLLQDSIDIVYTSQGTTPTGNQVFSRWLLAPQGASGTAHLLIQSIADPNQVDTCNVFVTP
ncbi:MAG TPA: hypothetical protein VLM37_08065, partial [Fibrobacteraceae bacterium]|nr:hypothetical protein [Fibrobacteraceae bacterium]